MSGLNEALLAELNERNREATHAQDDDQVQDVIDALDEALGGTLASGALYGQGVRRLRRWCRKSGRVPSSYTLADAVELESARALSSSALSDVYVGRSRGTKVAIKALRLHVDGHESIHKSFRNEVVTWKCLRHPNIVPFLGISDLFPVCIVSEWMPGGTISAFLIEHPRENRSRYIQQIVRGLEFMHALGVIHGDLKPSNILVDEKRHARLTDFGMATVLFNSSTQATTITGEGVGGTMRFMAPELLTAPAPGSEGPMLSVSSDVYALAITIWEIFSGQVPFPHLRRDHTILLQVLAGERPFKPTASPDIGFTDSVWNVMERGWAAEPDRRPMLAAFQIAIAPDILRLRDLAVAQNETTAGANPMQREETFSRRRQPLNRFEADIHVCPSSDSIDHNVHQVKHDTSQQHLRNRVQSNVAPHFASKPHMDVLCTLGSDPSELATAARACERTTDDMLRRVAGEEKRTLPRDPYPQSDQSGPYEEMPRPLHELTGYSEIDSQVEHPRQEDQRQEDSRRQIEVAPQEAQHNVDEVRRKELRKREIDLQLREEQFARRVRDASQYKEARLNRPRSGTRGTMRSKPY